MLYCFNNTKTKIKMEEQQNIEDLQLAYAEGIDRITSEWVHDDDGGVNHSQTGERKTMFFGNVMLIFQPIGKHDEWHEDASIIIAPKKDSEFKITEAVFNKVKPLFEEAENKFIASYNEFVTTYGFWLFNTHKPTFKNLLGIINPISFDNGRLKMKFNIGCYVNEKICRWSGKILRDWIYSLPAYERYRLKEFEETTRIYEDALNNLDKEIKIMEEELPTIPNQLHYISVESNLKNYIEVREERVEYYLREKEELKKSKKFGDRGGTSGEWQTKEYMEDMEGREDEIAEKLKNPESLPVTLEDAFPDRVRPKIILKIKLPNNSGVSGVKRVRE